MKNINKILLMLTWAVFAFSCEDDPILYSSGDYVAFENASSSVGENNASAGIQLYRSGADLSQPLTVEYTMSAVYTATTDFFDEGDDASDAIETFGGTMTVTIPAGEAYGNITVYAKNDDLTSGNKAVTISITGAGGYNIGLPGPDGNNSSHALTVVDDDCPTPPFVGDRPVTTVVSSPGSCGTVTSTVTVTLVSENPDGSTTYSFSDITGGHYPNCYTASENPGEVIIDGDQVLLIAQPDVVYGGDQFDGVGAVNSCDGTFTLTWSNGYGDSAVSTYQF